MGGDSGTPTLATLVTNGALTGADAQRAYAAVLRQARTACRPARRSRRLPPLGYIPYDHSDRGAAVTLEYAIDDAAVAALAATYGTADEVTRVPQRARSLAATSRRDRQQLPAAADADGTWAIPTPFGEAPTVGPGCSPTAGRRAPAGSTSGWCRRTSRGLRDDAGRRHVDAAARRVLRDARQSGRRRSCRSRSSRRASSACTTSATSTRPPTRPTCSRPGSTTGSASRRSTRRSCTPRRRSSTRRRMACPATTTPARCRRRTCCRDRALPGASRVSTHGSCRRRCSTRSSSTGRPGPRLTIIAAGRGADRGVRRQREARPHPGAHHLADQRRPDLRPNAVVHVVASTHLMGGRRVSGAALAQRQTHRQAPLSCDAIPLKDGADKRDCVALNSCVVTLAGWFPRSSTRRPGQPVDGLRLHRHHLPPRGRRRRRPRSPSTGRRCATRSGRTPSTSCTARSTTRG